MRFLCQLLMKKPLYVIFVATIMLSALGCSSMGDESETQLETCNGNEVMRTDELENDIIVPLIIPSKEDEKPDIEPQEVQSAEEFYITSVDSGNVILSAYKGSGGDVVIPDGVTEIAPHVFDLIMNPHGITITSVYIPDSVKIIGEYAFLSCYSLDGGLMSVRMSQNIEKIGKSAFDNCIYLTVVTFDETPAHQIEIGNKAFAYCEKIERCDLYGLPNCTLGEDVYIGTSLYRIPEANQN